jgi:signal transduction histidine kinase/iron only hydrogenase large subunit-like protein
MVIQERCIGCGSCVRVCTQKAKKIESGVRETLDFFRSKENTIALLAPSFPAAFHDQNPLRVVGALHRLGFDRVVQVAVGADALAVQYAELAVEKKPVISTPCPAVVYFIEKYHPDLLPYLAPLVSPMIATAKIVRSFYDKNARVVFIGPCIAKKKEKDDRNVKGLIDQVLTFEELYQILNDQQIAIYESPERQFDDPQPRLGAIFPISGGLLRAAGLEKDVLQNDIIVTEGSERVLNILQRLQEGELEEHFFDLLFCEGCINGPGMVNDLSVFTRKDIIVNFVKKYLRVDHPGDPSIYKIPLQRDYEAESITAEMPSEGEIKKIFAQINKFKPEDELNCGACGYFTCREKAIAVYQGIAEVEMCFPYLIERLEKVNKELMNAQQRVVRSAQLATMGKMATNIAHEINNPLSGVLNYLKFMQKLIDSDSCKLERFKKYLLTMENETTRVSEFVKGLLDFAKPAEPQIQKVSAVAIIEKTLFIVSHQVSVQNIKIEKEFPNQDLYIKADFTQIQQILINMIINSAQAMPDGGTIVFRVKKAVDTGFVQIDIEDTGAGISPEHKDKIFEPFFTTRDHDSNIGLGLSTAYSIILMHDGDIEVKSQVGKGTCFTLKIPEFHDR